MNAPVVNFEALNTPSLAQRPIAVGDHAPRPPRMEHSTALSHLLRRRRHPIPEIPYSVKQVAKAIRYRANEARISASWQHAESALSRSYAALNVGSNVRCRFPVRALFALAAFRQPEVVLWLMARPEHVVHS